MDRPIVSITIPTRNSARFIERCIRSINSQTYGNIEVNVVDGDSSDNTLDIVKSLGVSESNVHRFSGSLLAARKLGTELAKGDIVLLLDSDQVLEPDAIERAVGMIQQKSLDMLVLEESVYKCETWLEKLLQADRELIHRVADFSPFSGTMLPRGYRRPVLLEAFANIPESVLKDVGGQDHAIIYYETWQLSQKVALLPNAVRHIEPRTYRELAPKFYRWGKTSVGAKNASPGYAYKQISPGEYSVDVQASSSSYVLALSEKFSGKWNIRNLPEGVSALHAKADGYANAWLIEPNGKEVSVALTYRPAAPIHTIVIISACAVVIATLWMLFAPILRRKRNTSNKPNDVEVVEKRDHEYEPQMS